MMRLPDLDRNATAAALDRLLGTPGIPDEYVDLRRGLWRQQVEAHDRWVSGDAGDRDRFLVDFLARLATGLRGPVLEGLYAAVRRDVTRIAPWISAARDEQVTAEVARLAQDAAIATTDALFVGRSLWAPLAYAAAPRSPRRAGSRGACPVCGAAAGLALIASDGHRHLCCSLCGTRWPLARVGCVFCGDGRQLETLAVRDDASRWLESCATCRRFIKTVDLRRRAGAPAIALVEALAGLTLDLIAENERLLPAASYVALV